ncbi:MAG TPA: hypothetical protein VFH83_03620 [Spirochaetia bacterium]|nr:hypothetical protein [Spirochaetia bacterium]
MGGSRTLRTDGLETPRVDGAVRVEGRLRNLLVLDGAVFLVCVLALYVLYRVPLLLSPLAVALLILGAAALLVLDAVLWTRGGIRSIELEPETLTMYRGRELRESRLDRRSVISVRIKRRLGRGSVTIVLATGNRIRIRDDPFPAAEFHRLVEALRRWG